MGAIWSATPTRSDKILVYTLFSIFLFLYPGIRGLQQYEELSGVSLLCGSILYASTLLAITLITFDNIRKKRTIAQSTDYKERVGISSIGAIPIITGLRGNIVWLLLPLSVAVWGAIGFFSLVFGPAYMVECSLTSMECKLFP